MTEIFNLIDQVKELTRTQRKGFLEPLQNLGNLLSSLQMEVLNLQNRLKVLENQMDEKDENM